MSSRHYSLKATKRDGAGKGIARALRRESKIPAVIYGDKKEPVMITLEAKDINLEYQRAHMFTSVCDLELGGQKHSVLARDIQLHPITDNVTHVDFLRVTDKTKIAVFIPLNFINEEESPGLKEKGSLSITRFEVEMICSAMDIPDHIDVDLTGKLQGDVLHISDAKLPAGTKPVIDRNFVIGQILAPRTMEEEVPTEAPVAAEVPASEVAAPDNAPQAGADKKPKKEGK